MNLKDYQKFTQSIWNNTSSRNMQLNHAALGLVCEAGEVGDLIKKQTHFNKDTDLRKIKEELGDTLYYFSQMCALHGWTIEEVLESNVKKLSKRYHQGSYSDKQANERADCENDS